MQSLKELCCITDTLKNAKKPIILYGMGDGADKILRFFDSINLKVSAIMASDEFVKNQSFHGFTVQNLASIKRDFSDFLIVVAFGSEKEEVINMLINLNKNHDMLFPTMPIISDCTMFTKSYFLSEFDNFSFVYDKLCDNLSKQIYFDILRFKITGKLEFLINAFSQKQDVIKLLSLSESEDYVDLGAYKGDTVLSFLKMTHEKYNSILALEPDKKNFLKLENLIKEHKNIKAINAAAHNEDTTLFFSKSKGRGSAISKNKTTISTTALALDNHINKASFIKIDVEGNEKSALFGLQKTIKTQKPKLLISAYHLHDDFFALIKQILSYNSDYKIYLSQKKAIPAWETELIFV